MRAPPPCRTGPTERPAPLSGLVADSWWRRHQMTLAPVLFLAPACLLFAIFVVYPIVYSIQLSFFSWDGLGTRSWVGLGNYLELSRDPVFYKAITNNLLWLLLYMLAPLTGLALALLLNQGFFGVGLVRAVFFFPFAISQVVVGLVFAWFFHGRFGLLNSAFGWMGLGPVAPLADETWAIVTIVVAGLWPQTAYCMIIYLAGLASMDRELIEAGRMDGARGWRLLWHVVLPQLGPATFIAIVVCVVGALRSFDLVVIMTRGGPYDSSTVLAYYMYEQTFLAFRYGYGAAIATVLFVIMDLYIAFFLWHMLRDERGLR